MKKTWAFFVSLAALLFLASPSPAASFHKTANIVGTGLAAQGNPVKESAGPAGPSQPNPSKPKPKPSPSK